MSKIASSSGTSSLSESWTANHNSSNNGLVEQLASSSNGIMPQQQRAAAIGTLALPSVTRKNSASRSGSSSPAATTPSSSITSMQNNNNKIVYSAKPSNDGNSTSSTTSNLKGKGKINGNLTIAAPSSTTSFYKANASASGSNSASSSIMTKSASSGSNVGGVQMSKKSSSPSSQAASAAAAAHPAVGSVPESELEGETGAQENSSGKIERRKTRTKKRRKGNANASKTATEDEPEEASISKGKGRANTASDAAAISSAAMERGPSNTSSGSTRSLPSRSTRSSKRKYAEDSEDEPTDEDDLLPEPSNTKSRKREKKVVVADDSDNPAAGRSTSHSIGHVTSQVHKIPALRHDQNISRSTSPSNDEEIKTTEGVNAEKNSQSALEPSQTMKSKSQDAAPPKAKRPKKRKRNTAKTRVPDIKDEDTNASETVEDVTAEEKASLVEAVTAETHASGVDDEERAASIPLEQPMTGSSASTPLTNSFKRQEVPLLRPDGHETPLSLHAKSEPISEDENRYTTTGTLGTAAKPSSIAGGSPTSTAQSSRQASTVPADAMVDHLALAPDSARQSVSSEGLDIPLLSSFLGTRSASAIDGGDEMSTGAMTTAMPSPAAEETDRQLVQPDIKKRSVPAATKKKRGRPPKRRGETEETPEPSTAPSEAAVLETQPDVNTGEPTVKSRLQATLARERQLIEDESHPLFKQALIDYETLRQDKIKAVQFNLDTKIEAWRLFLQAREKSLWETWQDDKTKLWYEMVMGYQKNARQLNYEIEAMEAESLDPSGLLGSVQANWWQGRTDGTASLLPPVVEPIIRVPVEEIAAPTGRTRSKAKTLVTAGEALVTPINMKDAQGLSALSRDEITLDLEIMGLSRHKVEENWFHNQKTPRAVSPKMEVETQMRSPMPEKVKSDLAPPLAGYPYPAPHEYAWPPYVDPNSAPGLAYPPYYHAPAYPNLPPSLPPPPRSAAIESAFTFPGHADRKPYAQNGEAAFAFPRSGRGHTKAGQSKADAILIDDEVSPTDPVPVPPGYTTGEPWPRYRSDPYHGSREGSLSIRHEPPKSPHRAAQQKDSRWSHAPEDVYPVKYSRQLDYELETRDVRQDDGRRRTSSKQVSPVQRNLANSPGQQAGDRGERRHSREYPGHGYDGRGENHPSYSQTHQNAGETYQAYYESSRGRNNPQNNPASMYPTEFFVDPWGRPVDPYAPPAYYHPAYSEQMSDQRHSDRYDPVHSDPYRREDPRDYYRGPSGYPDDPYYRQPYPNPYPPYPPPPRGGPSDRIPVPSSEYPAAQSGSHHPDSYAGEYPTRR